MNEYFRGREWLAPPPFSGFLNIAAGLHRINVVTPLAFGQVFPRSAAAVSSVHALFLSDRLAEPSYQRRQMAMVAEHVASEPPRPCRTLLGIPKWIENSLRMIVPNDALCSNIFSDRQP